MNFDFHGGRKLCVNEDRLDVYSGEWQLFSFPISSRVNLYEREDADSCINLISEERGTDCTTLIWEAQGSIWEQKKYIVQVYSDHLTYRIDVSGQGTPSDILYFRGGKDSQGTSYYTAGYLLCRAEHADYERAKYPVGTNGTLYPSMMSPPPFVFPFWNDYNTDQIGVGLAAAAGQNNYERFGVKYIRPDISWFELPLLGYTWIDENWVSPEIWIGFGETDMEVIGNYSQWACSEFHYPEYVGSKNAPSWWKRPIFCSWLEQYFLDGCTGKHMRKYAAQKYFSEMLQRMERVGLKPGTIIIDDKWQTDYGTMMPDTDKWPDLRGFVDTQHEAGRHVLLWTRLWHREGLPAAWCTRVNDEAITADPTNPHYLSWLKKQIHYLLSDDPGCMNCDGFKLDFLFEMPREQEGISCYEPGVYGLELMRRYYKAIYDFAKEVKPDALINTSVAHPYFADICDMMRLHDYNATQRFTVSVMRFRAAVVRAVLPDMLIDTDGANMETGNTQHILYHNRAAIEEGVPALYGLSQLTDDELQEIQRVWDIYEAEKV